MYSSAIKTGRYTSTKKTNDIIEVKKLKSIKLEQMKDDDPFLTATSSTSQQHFMSNENIRLTVLESMKQENLPNSPPYSSYSSASPKHHAQPHYSESELQILTSVQSSVDTSYTRCSCYVSQPQYSVSYKEGKPISSLNPYTNQPLHSLDRCSSRSPSHASVSGHPTDLSIHKTCRSTSETFDLSKGFESSDLRGKKCKPENMKIPTSTRRHSMTSSVFDRDTPSFQSLNTYESR